MYCCWRSSYQEGRVSISLNPTICLCLSQARTWISNVICRGLFCVQWVQLRWEVIVGFLDIGGIDDHHCLNFLFINNNAHDKIVLIYTRKRSKFRDGLTNFRIYISKTYYTYLVLQVNASCFTGTWNWLYSQTCIKRTSLWQRNSGLIRQLTSLKGFNLYEIFCDMTIKRWPFDTDDCLIEVTVWAGLAVIYIIFKFLVPIFCYGAGFT